MTYKCIKCGFMWVIGPKSDAISGGICDDCITMYIRDKQKSRGEHDCFRRAIEICSMHECEYHWVCCRYLRKEESCEGEIKENIIENHSTTL